jgi:amidohydrolase
MRLHLVALLLLAPAAAVAQSTSLRAAIDQRTQAVTPKVVAWRRDIHQHPELGNREFRTSALVEGHLRALGMDVPRPDARQ